MTPTDNPTPGDTTMTAAPNDIRKVLESLRTMFHLAALCGIVLAAVMYVFLYKQVAGIQRQNTELNNYIQDYNTTVVPSVELARKNLQAYGQTNASFAPVFRKYFTNSLSAGQ